MATSSSSICIPPVKYDVFLSFRGEDTRNNFTSHLYAALCRKGLSVFIDEKLKRGDEIFSLMNVIQGSKISVIILSKDYASSRWTLEELAKILECKKKCGQIVIPIFYHVDPSDVRFQTRIFGEAFIKHKVHFKDKMQRWRTALEETADLSGWHLDETKSESTLIEKIIQDILKRLKDMSSSDNKDLVGVESIIQKIESSFWVGINDVRTIGIWGIGGIGKTTIASAIYNKISSQFESYYFAQNVREVSENPNGLIHLRGKIISTLLDDINLCIGTPNMGNTVIEERLRNKKVFIVLDDVTLSEQIEELIGDLKDLGFGSRIIITTRNKQVLRNCGVDQTHHIVGLFGNHAFQLFSRFAFKQDGPLVGYIELSDRAVRCAKGVPLALKVLGRFLQNRQKQVWESALDKLEESPHQDIQKVLKISYDGLDDGEKDLFLDIACFFNLWDEYLVREILNSCGLHVQIGISVLIDKALITTSYNKIIMHDLLQAMGREIVKQESIQDPGKRSRLWHHNDIYNVLTYNMGTEKIRGICFDIVMRRAIHLTPLAFLNMHNLRFLIINRETNNKVHGFHRLKSNFKELRYLCWHDYPERWLPSKFHPECLVVLKMRHSNLKQLWNGVMNLANLKCIDLSYSNRLLKIPDLSYATNLESLILEDCSSLLKITPLSIQNVNSLINLNLRNCKSITSLPIGIQSKSLRFVILSGCSNLKMAPKISCNMEQLCLDGSGIKQFSSVIEYPPKLVELNLENCSKLKCLPNNFSELKSLRHLVLRGCSNLKTISKLPCEVVELDLEGTAVKELPSSIMYLTNLLRLKLTSCSKLESLPQGFGHLKSLKYLDISNCSKLDKLPKDFANLQSLEVLETNEIPIRDISSIACLSKIDRLSLERCKSLDLVSLLSPTLSGLRFLMRLSLSNCNIIDLPNRLDGLSSLYELNLVGNNFESIPTSILNLSKLELLDLSYCKRLQFLPKLPCKINFLEAESCTSLQALSCFPGSAASRLSFINCFKLELNSSSDLANGKGFSDYGITIGFPGSEIPNWFSFQSDGCFIELPRGSLNHITGFAFCTVLAFQDYDHYDDRALIVEYLISKDGCELDFGFFYAWDEGSRPCYIESDHIFLAYEFRKFSYSSEAIISFKVTNQFLKCASPEYCKIKKCGVHFIRNERQGMQWKNSDP